MGSMLKGSVRFGSKLGVILAAVYIAIIFGAFLITSMIGIAKIVSTPGVWVAGQLHNFGVEKGIDWLSVMTPQSILDTFTTQYTTTLITGTIAIVAVAALANVVIYYVVGWLIEKYM